MRRMSTREIEELLNEYRRYPAGTNAPQRVAYRYSVVVSVLEEVLELRKNTTKEN